ncbi:hypothetical protein C8Q76DRAFT_739585 [Earliella scabrosa]|nr:hypothetical protein C8Q76DRAFT_739585 [Earliella scabrosa]
MSTSHDTNLNRTFGAILLGAFISVIIYGVALHQTYRYFRLFPSDTPFIRTLVVSLLILETLQVIFSIHTNYYYLVTNYFRPDALTQAVWSANLIAVTGALITIVSQLFFLRRVSMISYRYKVISAFAGVFLVATLVGDILLAFYGFDQKRLSVYVDKQWLIVMTFGSLTMVNILITGSLLAVVRQARPQVTGSDTYFELFKIYVINTGVIILIFDLLALILSGALANTLYWVTFYLVASRMYMTTLLSVLNSRKLVISRDPDVFDAGTFGANIITRANRIAAAERWNVPQIPDEQPPSMIDIKVTTEVEGADSVSDVDMTTVTSKEQGSKRYSNVTSIQLQPNRRYEP